MSTLHQTLINTVKEYFSEKVILEVPEKGLWVHVSEGDNKSSIRAYLNLEHVESTVITVTVYNPYWRMPPIKQIFKHNRFDDNGWIVKPDIQVTYLKEFLIHIKSFLDMNSEWFNTYQTFKDKDYNYPDEW
jgi:hypothetical protein